MKKILMLLLLTSSFAWAGDAELFVIEVTPPPTPSVTPQPTPSGTPMPTPKPHMVKPSSKDLAKMREHYNFNSHISISFADEKIYLIRDLNGKKSPFGGFFPDGTNFILRPATDEEIAEYDRKLNALDEDEAEEQKESVAEKAGLAKLEMQLGFGASLPSAGNRLSKTYGSGSAFNLGFGIKLTPSFAVILALEAGSFSFANNAANQNSQFLEGDLAILGKFRFATEDFRPYVFGGPGLEFNGYNLNFTYNGLPATAGLSETDLMLEGGVGVEVQIVPTFFLFVQGGVDYDLNSQSFADTASVDKPTVFFPVLAGIVWGR